MLNEFKLEFFFFFTFNSQERFSEIQLVKVNLMILLSLICQQQVKKERKQTLLALPIWHCLQVNKKKDHLNIHKLCTVDFLTTNNKM